MEEDTEIHSQALGQAPGDLLEQERKGLYERGGGARQDQLFSSL